MTESRSWTSGGVTAKYAGYDRIAGVICWLLLALVSLHINLLPADQSHTMALAASSLALFCYRSMVSDYLAQGRRKASTDLFVLLLFVVDVCWFTGKTASPFIPVIYLILIAASLALGLNLTYLMTALAIGCYLALGFAQAPGIGTSLAARLVELFPFFLSAHLGILLSGEAEAARAEAERLSLTDDLTELHNMRSFENLALQQEKLSKRYGKPFSICMIDADNLKQVNDKHGHLAGTELIKWTARIIAQNTRECDIAARFGGDEFIIMYEGHGKEQIRPAVERIVRAMARSPFKFEEHLVESTLSAGIASFPADGGDLRSVIMRADEAMYLSKRLGKNMVSLYYPEPSRKTRALQVGGEKLERSVPELDRKTASVNLGESDFP